MGWPILLGWYFSLAWAGVLIGTIYPIYVGLNKEHKNHKKIGLEIIFSCFFGGLKGGAYAVLLLTIFAFMAGVLFTLWAIVQKLST